ncbi:MAG: protein kinase [Candidatus Hydrogenedentales bacterium]
MSLSPGSVLGTHEIVGLLGAGGMGEVYRARDTKLNRQVAIKVLPEAYASDPDRVARFHREAQAVAALNHPNIAAIYDLAQSGSTKFLVLELIEGETLADRLRRGAVPPEEALLIIKQVLEALEAAHEKGICHRDLKPANIKISAEGVVKVLDFGLAKFMQTPGSQPLLSNSPTLSVAGTIPGVILGTAGYMSPEQAKGYEADHRSDLFSVGCILYELLSGHQAFQGETASEILAGVLKSDVDFSRLPPRLNPRLTELLRRCLEKNPKKRWHAAADLRVEVESLLGHAVVNEAASHRADRPLWRRAAPLVAAAVVGAVIAGAAVWMLRPEVDRPVVRLAVPLPEGATLPILGRNILAVSPDGAHLVYAGNGRLYLRPLSELEAREIPGSSLDGAALNPVFSPDGESVAFWSQTDATIKRLPRNGGAAVTVCAARPPYGMSWSQHGIVFGELSRGILRCQPAGGQPELIAASEPGEIASTPVMLPDGKAVMFAVRREPQPWEAGAIVVQELGGTRQTIFEGGADPRLLPTGHLVFARAGNLLAVAFDARARRVTGGPVAVLEGVRRATLSPSGPTTGAAHFSFSATGTAAYLTGSPLDSGEGPASYDLALFDKDGLVKSFGLPRRPYTTPRVSRDGRLVAVEVDDSKETDIWTYEIAEGRTPQRLTSGGHNRHPVWSSDGRWVIFQSDRDGDRAIFRQLADGSGEAERLTKPDAGVELAPLSASPDGAHILFSTRLTSEWSLSILSLSDRRIIPFGNVTSAERTDGAFSPDGKWIVYQKRDQGRPRQVFVKPFPATAANYQVGPGGHPFFEAKGDAIVVNAGPGTSQRIPFTSSPRVVFGQPQPLSRISRLERNPSAFARTMDPMPGGSQFIGISTGESTTADATQINVVINWFEHIKRQVPR